MSKSIEQQIFKKGSRTYYFSARFFPKKIRRDVFRLYSFLRINDDAVDTTDPKPGQIQDIEKQYQAALKEQHFDATTHAWDEVPDRIVKNMVRLTEKYKLEPELVTDFLSSMKKDVKGLTFRTLDDVLGYVHGSAEVVGVMMAKIMKLPEEAYEAAMLQGRAMQWLNFLRDIKEDNELQRRYFPDEDLKKAGLADLEEQTARDNPEAFKKFVDIQLRRYHQWQDEARQGFAHIPKRLRVPVQTASDMYDWTAKQIEKDPFIIFDKKVKPRKSRVIAKATTRSARAAAGAIKTKATRVVRAIKSA